MDKIYHNFIADKEKLRSFYFAVFNSSYNFLRMGEAWFVCASARNKELSEDERKDFGISNAEMYHAELVTKDGFDAFYQMLCRFECNADGYVSKIGRKPFPQKCLGFYATVNPISIKKAFLLRMKEIQDTFELAITSNDKNNESILKSMTRCIKLSNKIATKAISKKHWLDIDIDFIASYKTKFDYYYKDIVEDLKFRVFGAMNLLYQNLTDNEVWPAPFNVVLVYTKNGMHVLFPVGYFSKGINPNTLLKALQAKFGEIAKEVEVTNGGCPIPGTLQRGFLVDFEEVDIAF